MLRNTIQREIGIVEEILTLNGQRWTLMDRSDMHYELDLWDWLEVVVYRTLAWGTNMKVRFARQKLE
jgi:hypothetical protein